MIRVLSVFVSSRQNSKNQMHINRERINKIWKVLMKGTLKIPELSTELLMRKKAPPHNFITMQK